MYAICLMRDVTKDRTVQHPGKRPASLERIANIPNDDP